MTFGYFQVFCFCIYFFNFFNQTYSIYIFTSQNNIFLIFGYIYLIIIKFGKKVLLVLMSAILLIYVIKKTINYIFKSQLLIPMLFINNFTKFLTY